MVFLWTGNRKFGIKRSSHAGESQWAGVNQFNGALEKSVMSRVCQVTGKRPLTGNNVSHANNKTKRRFLPNLQKHRFWSEQENRWVSLRVSTKGMRIIDKLGIDQVISDMRKRGEKV